MKCLILFPGKLKFKMTSINFKTRGKGLPIIFIHGFCETLEIWESFIQKIEGDFQIVTLDLPGFGSSNLNHEAVSIDDIGALINNWTVEQDFDKPILVGHSLGGYVSLSMMTQKPELFSGLVLLHSTARADTEEKKHNRDKVKAFVRENGLQPFFDSFVPGLYFLKDHESIPIARRIASETSESTFMAYTNAMRDRVSRESTLAQNKVPMLIIAGQNDAIIDVRGLEEQAQLSEKIRFYSLPNVGHMGFFEAEIDVVKIITDYANQVKGTLPA